MIVFWTLMLIWALFMMIVPPGGLKHLARERKYKSGTGWCFWKWSEVESEYILRLHVFKTPWFAVCLHWIQKPDREPWLHDHPVSFLSLILRGGYAEVRQKPGEKPKLLVHRWLNFIRASDEDKHRIIFCRKNTLTLCFMGPKTREWGFHFQSAIVDGEDVVWLGWKRYYALLKGGVPVRSWDFGGSFGYEKELYADFNDAVCDHYTEARIAALAGYPIGKVEDTETREIDTAPAAAFKPEDFDDESPTVPR